MTLPDSHKSYRPLAVFTLRLNHILGGLSPRGYHAVNLVLHGTCTALVMALVQAVVAPNGLHESSVKGRIGTAENQVSLELRALGATTAAVAGFLFAAHPVHVEPVASVVGRADLLCAAFSLAALLCYVTAARRCWRLGRGLMLAAFALAFLASLAKEIGVTTFGLFVAHEIIEAVVVAGDSDGGADVGAEGRVKGTSGGGGGSGSIGVGSVPAALQVVLGALEAARRRVAEDPSGAGLRVAAAAACACAVVAAHLSLHGEHRLYR